MIDKFDGLYRFLSNFHPCEITDSFGLTYGSVEAAYQASKTLDREIRAKFTKLGPGAAKRFGKTIKIREDWSEEVKVLIMLNLLSQKFSRIDLTLLLLATCDQELIEGNTWGDTFWGVCDGEGRNILGELLMYIRKNILNENSDNR